MENLHKRGGFPSPKCATECTTFGGTGTPDSLLAYGPVEQHTFQRLGCKKRGTQAILSLTQPSQTLPKAISVSPTIQSWK